MFGTFGPRGWLVLNKCRYTQYAIQLVDEENKLNQNDEHEYKKDKGGEDKASAAKGWG